MFSKISKHAQHGHVVAALVKEVVHVPALRTARPKLDDGNVADKVAWKRLRCERRSGYTSCARWKADGDVVSCMRYFVRQSFSA